MAAWVENSGFLLPSSQVGRTVVGIFSLLAVPLQRSPFKGLSEVLSSQVIAPLNFLGCFSQLEVPILGGCLDVLVVEIPVATVLRF